MNKNLYTGIALLLVMHLSGCASIVLSGGGQQGQSNQYPQRSASDTKLINQINSMLVRDRQVNATDIYVSSISGNVTLAGSVNSHTQKQRAEQLVRGLPGVYSVKNKIRVQ